MTPRQDPPMRMHQRLPDDDAVARQHGRHLYFDLWYGIVEDFSGRNMKFKNDVLPAISGLAQTFAPFMDDDDPVRGRTMAEGPEVGTTVDG